MNSSTLPKSPIFVMSFNRPSYLEQVLISLMGQKDCDLESRKIVLFQDGAFNTFSQTSYATEEEIAACIKVFSRLVPQGEIFASLSNLGVALNFDRAEKYGFETLGAESIIFLEDDLVLQPHYISTVDYLLEKFKDDKRIGYVSAYGKHTATLEDQMKNKNQFVSMTHNWGFAVYKRHWTAIRPKVLQYLDIVKKDEYRKRDRESIRALFSSWGFGCPADSQDAAKTIASLAENTVKVNTYVCNAKYIGKQGLHMNSKIYETLGYDKTELFPDQVTDFVDIDNATFQRLMADQKGWANAQLPKPQQAGKAEAAKPSVSAETGKVDISIVDLIHSAYQAVLKRDPDPDGLAAYIRLFKARSSQEAVQNMLKSMLGSSEFRRKFKPD